jgi:hypothetical protein
MHIDTLGASLATADYINCPVIIQICKNRIFGRSDSPHGDCRPFALDCTRPGVEVNTD